MIQPNSDAIGFTNWMLNISKQHLSGPQRVIVQEIYNAAVGVFPVTNQTWYNFNLFAAWRNPYYLVYRDYATVVPPALTNGLIASWSFDGNLNDELGTYTAISNTWPFNTTDALIGECIKTSMTGANAVIPTLGPISNYTVSFWIRPDSAPASAWGVFGSFPIVSDCFYDGVAQQLQFTSGATMFSGLIIPISTWSMITITVEAGFGSMWVNSIKVVNNQPSFGDLQFDTIGYFGFGAPIEMAMDIMSVWDRKLTDEEILAYYNTGIGIQYPF